MDCDTFANVRWMTADASDRRRLEIIEMALVHHPHLIPFLFHPSKPETRVDTDRLEEVLGGMSGGEKILCRLALDLWNGSGKLPLMELSRLDPFNFSAVISAMLDARRFGIL